MPVTEIDVDASGIRRLYIEVEVGGWTLTEDTDAEHEIANFYCKASFNSLRTESIATLNEGLHK